MLPKQTQGSERGGCELRGAAAPPRSGRRSSFFSLSLKPGLQSLPLRRACADRGNYVHAYSAEALALAGLHLGACLSTGPAAMHAFPRLTAVPGASAAASYVVGLVGLGVFRQLLSVVSKVLVRSLPKGGGGLASPAVARPLVVSLITASYLLTLHPTQLVAWVV